MRKAVRAIVVKDDKLLVIKRNKFGKQYYVLPGGAVNSNENGLQALVRELNEETSIQITDPRLVYVESAPQPYGDQYIFLCNYDSGEPMLDPNSEEAKIHAMGQNLYIPLWLPLEEVATADFITPKLRDAVIHGIKTGFPNQPQPL